MDIDFVPPDLRRLDLLQSEACWLPFFSDDRPFRGVLGLVDWRMGAYLSRQVIRGRIKGAAGEVLLLPCERFLPFEKLFLYGLGRRDAFDLPAFESAVTAMLQTFASIRVRAAVCDLPGRASGEIEPEEAMAGLLRCSRGFDEQDELTVVEDTAAQRVMEPVIAQERRRERAAG